jgi:hypothetical protein
MNATCEQIKKAVSEFSLVKACDDIRNGMVRLATPFQYPNGAVVDLFLGQKPELFDKWVLTDLGQTTAWLLDLNLKLWTTEKRKQIVTDICKGLDVTQDGGQFQLVLADMKQLPDAMVRLSQACLRVADLAFTQRLRVASEFNEDFEEFLDLADASYQPNFSIQGQFGKIVKVDFKVKGRRSETLVQTLSTPSRVASHTMSNEAFSRWYDLQPHHKNFQFLSVYDTTNDSFRDDDLARLNSVSLLMGYPAQEQDIKEVLAS